MHTKIAAAALCALTAAAAPAASFASPAYKLTPLIITPGGNFTPVAISDTSVTPGTYNTASGSTVGFGYEKFKGYLLNDFCGSAGASDRTAYTAMSPYSSTEFLAGDCGNGTGFSYDLQAGAATSVVYPAPGATTTNGINNGGLVVGTHLDTSFRYHGFYKFGSSYIPFDAPGAVNTFPAGINTSSVVFGRYQASNPALPEVSGFLLDIFGNTTSISYPGAYWTEVTGVNANSLAAGNFYSHVASFPYEQAFAYTSGFFYTLPMNNVLTAHVSAINEAGIATGTYQLTSGKLGFYVWKVATGSIITVPVPAGTTVLQMNGINNANVVTGSYFNSTKSKWVAFIGNCSGTSCF